MEKSISKIREELKKDIFEFTKYKNNWYDEDQGVPLSKELYEYTISIVDKFSDSQILKVSDVYLNPNGLVTIEFSGEKEFNFMCLDIQIKNSAYFTELTSKRKLTIVENIDLEKGTNFKKVCIAIDSLDNDKNNK